MKYHFLLFAFIVLNSCSVEDNTVQNSVQNNDAFTIIPQDKSSYENGYLHGKTITTQINQYIETWQVTMQKELGLSKDSLLSIVFKQTGFIKTIQQHCPELIEEINGIADGAAIDRKLLLAYNLGEEIYNFCKIPTERCSNLAIKMGDKNILTYNQDLPPFLHGINKPVVLKHKDYFAFSFPGTIGISGVSKTLAISCNSLPMLKMDKNGLPLSFLIRKLLSFNSLSKAKAFLQQTNCAIPQNLLLVAAEDVMGFELSQNEVKEYGAIDNTFLYHTNFPIHNTNYKKENYTIPKCNRYAAIESFIQSVQDSLITATKLTTAFSKSPLQNSESYLRFTATFYKKKSKLPAISFINPQQNNAVLVLQF